MALFVQICDPVRRESEMRKTCKTKIKQDHNTPIASWSSDLHLAAFCSYLFFPKRNGRIVCRKHSTQRWNKVFLAIEQRSTLVTGTIYGCDELQCLSQHLKNADKKKGQNPKRNFGRIKMRISQGGFKIYCTEGPKEALSGEMYRRCSSDTDTIFRNFVDPFLQGTSLVLQIGSHGSHLMDKKEQYFNQHFFIRFYLIST